MATAPLLLMPAVDVAHGRAVRLVRGGAGSETVYGAPLDAALAWQAGGALWVHLVDLDAALGRGSDRKLIAEVVGCLDVAVELSRGGICDDESLAAALATGCARVTIGTVALERPDWVRRAIAEHGERISVGLDVSGSMLSHGGTGGGGQLFDELARLDADGCGRYVITDVRPRRHVDWSEPRSAAGRVRRDRATDRRQRWRVEPRRPAGHCGAGADRRRGRDRRNGPVQRGRSRSPNSRAQLSADSTCQDSTRRPLGDEQAEAELGRLESGELAVAFGPRT